MKPTTIHKHILKTNAAEAAHTHIHLRTRREARKAHNAAIIQVDIVFNRTCIKCTVWPNRRSYSNEQFIRLLPYLYMPFRFTRSTTPPTAECECVLYVRYLCMLNMCHFWNTIRSLFLLYVLFIHFTFSTLYYFKHNYTHILSKRSKKNVIHL